MEPALRGLIERFIDEGLKPERLEDIYKGLGDLLPLAKSKEDMLLGYFIGNIYGIYPILYKSSTIGSQAFLRGSSLLKSSSGGPLR